MSHNISKQISARTLKRIEPATITTQLYLHLRAAIIHGELRPGQALSESEISKQYSTSRQPVREAFIKLADDRLVNIVPQRGTYVVMISVADVLDARFVREAIESAVVSEAATSASSSTIKKLRDLIERQKEAAQKHSLNGFLALDEEFHRTISFSVGRAHAWRVIESIKAQMDRIRFLSLGDSTPLSLLIEQHMRIVDGIESHDPKAAVEAVCNHLREIIVSLPNIALQFPDVFEAAN